MSIGAWLPVGVALLLCSCRPPSPIEVAESACHADIVSVIESGACDSYQTLDQCPGYQAALTGCVQRLDKAERQEASQ